MHKFFNENIQVYNCVNQAEGLALAKKFLYEIVDRKTVLFLSGGKTPKDLYISLAREKKLHPGAAAMIDERFGEKFHEASNEKMIQDTGLLSYFASFDIPFYPILQKSIRKEIVDRSKVAKQYDATLGLLFTGLPKSIGILGIGIDGHTAGIPSGRKNLQKNENASYVTDYANFQGEEKERISMTFTGLSMLDYIIVLVFGKDKMEVLRLMFKKGSEEEVPARFFKRSDIAPKTLLITDQTV